MPVFHPFRDVDDVAGMEADGRLAPFLVDALSTDADKYLVCSVMDVLVVATARFKGDVGITLNCLFAFRKVLWLNLREVTLPGEILGVGIVWIAFWPVAFEFLS